MEGNSLAEDHEGRKSGRGVGSGCRGVKLLADKRRGESKWGVGLRGWKR